MVAFVPTMNPLNGVKDENGVNKTESEAPKAEPEELVGKTCIAIVNLPPRPMMGIDSCGMPVSYTHLLSAKKIISRNLIQICHRF